MNMKKPSIVERAKNIAHRTVYGMRGLRPDTIARAKAIEGGASVKPAAPVIRGKTYMPKPLGDGVTAEAKAKAKGIKAAAGKGVLGKLKSGRTFTQE